MKRVVCGVVMAMVIAGCAAGGTTVATTVSATAGAVLNGVQAVTAVYGESCKAGLLPARYCQYVEMAWFAEQQLATAWEVYVKEPTAVSLAAFEAAKCAAQEAMNAANNAKAEEGVE